MASHQVDSSSHTRGLPVNLVSVEYRTSFTQAVFAGLGERYGINQEQRPMIPAPVQDALSSPPGSPPYSGVVEPHSPPPPLLPLERPGTPPTTDIEPTCNSKRSTPTSTTPQPPEKGRKTPRLPWATQIWAFEIAASLLSIGCVVTIVCILASVQGKPLDRWRQGSYIGSKVPPTAVVSFLGTIGRSACLVACAEIISQLKWMHFRGSRPQKLVDLQDFDNASRGPWGALKLAVAQNKAAVLAALTSVLVVAALFVGPFVQLVFSFPSVLTPVTGPGVVGGGDTTGASILTSQLYDPTSLDSRFGQCYGGDQLDYLMQAAVLTPIWNATQSPDLPCGFERCDWPTITTLGVCSNCIDLTDTVVADCAGGSTATPSIDCTYRLPTVNEELTGRFAVTGGASSMVEYQPLWRSTAPQLVDGKPAYTPRESQPPHLIQLSFVSFEPDLPWTDWVERNNDDDSSTDTPRWKVTKSPPVKQAMQCSLSLCARTFTKPYYVNSTAGPLSGPETPLVVTGISEQIQGTGAQIVDLQPAPDPLADKTTSATIPSLFQINLCDHIVLSRYLLSIFITRYNSNGMTGTSSSSSTNTPSSLSASSSSSSSSSSNNTPPNPDDYQPTSAINLGLSLHRHPSMPLLMQSIAGSMTEVFRTTPRTSSSDASSISLPGTGYRTITIISIAWGWLALPIALVVSAFVMLVVVIVRNAARGVPAWKSSSLAVLFHETEGWDGRDESSGGVEGGRSGVGGGQQKRITVDWGGGQEEEFDKELGPGPGPDELSKRAAGMIGRSSLGLDGALLFRKEYY